MEKIKYWINLEGVGHILFLIFPIALLCLFICFKGRRIRFLIPILLITIVIINPLFYKIWDELGLYAYWRILWIVPVIPTIAALIPSICEKFVKRWITGFIVFCGVGFIIFSGTFLYNGIDGLFVETTHASKIPDYVVTIANKLLELKENPRVIVQHPLGVYIRQYTGCIDILYGRDIDKYILMADSDARKVHNQLNDGEFEAVAQFMLDDGYDYLVYSGDTGEQFELIETVDNYGIYKAIGTPLVIKDRDDLGRVIRITYVDAEGHYVYNEKGYSSVLYTYDNNGNLIREFYTDTNGLGVANDFGIAGYERGYDNHSYLIWEKTIGSDRNPIIAYRNYAEIRYEYKDGNVVKESYFDIDGNPMMQPAGYVAISQEWDNDKLLSRTYLDIKDRPVDRVDGYSKVDWSRGYVTFYNSDGIEVPIEGINLFIEDKTNTDGWSEWIAPETYKKNYCVRLGNVNLGDKSKGDVYICQIEIEFKNITVADDGIFWFRSQGAQDGKWFTDNIWNDNLINLRDPPTDGVYIFTSTVTISDEMANVSAFSLELRCDDWASGSFRIRHIKIEKNSQISDWTCGI